jgi:hypothetical protein
MQAVAPRKQKGFSLLEVCLALGIAGVISAITVSQAKHHQNLQGASGAVAELRMTLEGTRSFYASGRNPLAEEEMSQMVQALKLVPSSALGEDGRWMSHWNTPVHLTFSEEKWIAQYSGIPSEGCVAFLAEVQQQPWGDVGRPAPVVNGQALLTTELPSLEKACASAPLAQVDLVFTAEPMPFAEPISRNKDPAKKRWGTLDAM